MDIVATSIILVFWGLCVGIFSGMLGIGGGTVMVPILRLACNLNAFMATATSLFAIIPISLSGAITHIRARNCIPKLGIILGLGGAISSSLGVHLAAISPAWLIMTAAAVILIYSAATMLSKAIKMKGGKKAPAEIEVAKATEEKFLFTRKRILLALVVGLVAGFASGYVGVGGGFIMVPLMIAWLDVPMKKTSGTSLIAIIILAIPGVIQQTILGHVDFLAGIMLCIGAIPGAVLGARLVPRVPERALRFIFSGFLAIAAVILVLNELGVFG